MFQFTIPAGTIPQSPRPLAASLAAHGLLFFLLFALHFSSGVSISHQAPQHVTLIAPLNFPDRAKEIPMLPPKAVTRLHEFHPPPPPKAHLESPMPIIAAPAIDIPKPILPEAPRVPETGAVIKTGGFSELKLAELPPRKLVVKTSEFQSSESKVAKPARGPVLTAGAFDSSPSVDGTPVGKMTAIARAGRFGDASVVSPNVTTRGSIQDGAFGDATVNRNAAPTQGHTRNQTSATPTFTPVEILSKPKPTYTDEARRKNIEGEVLLEMQFSASGEARVLRVVRGIGHGLDETAMTAALGIRYRPATRNGGAVDSDAIVRIIFQLAN